MNKKTGKLIVTTKMIEILFSETWIIDTLVLLKSYMNGELYIHGVNTSFLCACFIYHSDYSKHLSDEQINNILIAAIIKDIGKTVSSNALDNYMDYSVEYINNCTQNKELINILKILASNEVTTNTSANLISILSKVETLLFNNNISNESSSFLDNDFSQFEQQDVKKLIYALEIINPFVKTINARLASYASLDNTNDINPNATPIQLVIDSILENTWINDYLTLLQSENKKTLYIHSLNTALLTATIIQYGNKNELNMNGYSKDELIIASLLHDIGYMNEMNLDLSNHLSFNLNTIQRGSRLLYVANSIDMLQSIFQKESVDNSDNIVEAIRNHHEFLDGSGYFELLGEEISYPVRIISLANAIDLQISHIEPNTNYEENIFSCIQNDELLSLIDEKFDMKIISNTFFGISVFLDKCIALFSTNQ